MKDGSDEYHKNFLPSTEPQVEEVLAQAELKNLFRRKLEEFRTELNDKELDILDLRLLAEKPMTLQEIGARHQISRERVRQIEDRLIKRLRHYLKNEIADWDGLSDPDRGLAGPGAAFRGTNLPNRKIFIQIKAMLCISASWSRIILGGILGVSLCLAALGCASLGRMAPNGTEVATKTETPKGLAYYHFLKAQQLLLADDAAGAIQEYEAVLKNDPDSPSVEMELAALYQRQGDVKQALAHAEKSSGWIPSSKRHIFSWPACTWASTS